MQATYWIDRVKSHKGLPSDYAVAKELGLTRSAVSSYRHKGFATLDEDACVKVGLVLGIDPLLVVADQARERTKNDDARSAWSAILERLGGVAASVFISAGLIGGVAFPPDANSAQRSQNNSNSAIENLYIV